MRRKRGFTGHWVIAIAALLAIAAAVVATSAPAATPVEGLRVTTEDGHSGLYDGVEMHLDRRPPQFIFYRRLFADSFEGED